jgi:hypothetical protein
MTLREKLARELCRWEDGSVFTPGERWEYAKDRRRYFREADRILKMVKGGGKQ